MSIKCAFVGSSYKTIKDAQYKCYNKEINNASSILRVWKYDFMRVELKILDFCIKLLFSFAVNITNI